MGDGADMALEARLDDEGVFVDWQMGHIDDTEAHDLGILDEEGFVYNGGVRGRVYQRMGPKRVMCRYCGGGPFVWKKHGDGWRLAEWLKGTGEIHSCAEYTQAKGDPCGQRTKS